MAIDVSVQHNGGFSPGIILLTQCYCHHRGTLFKCHEDVLYLQPVIPPTKRFDIFPLIGGCSKGLDAFRFFLKQQLLFLITDSWAPRRHYIMYL